MRSTLAARQRSVPLGLTILIALVAGMLAFTVERGSAHAEGTSAHDHDVAASAVTTPAQVTFHDQMRKLWEDHVTWTRLAIVTFADGSAGFDATATRLLQNQTDIGNAIAPFYGQAAGDELSTLLHGHINIAVQILQDAKAGDTAAFNTDSARWYDNANQIADFLSALNPRFWPDDVMRAAMKEHLDQTLAEAQDELNGNYTASVNDYEAIHLHILAMADLLSSGIVNQFPGRFR
ncbi:MAG TPA: hypothetical protein VFQ44_00580 [Streptosporangiaceae bacterium]|nr:hypothetical protein [Streptosporangiaceae bacterium]